MLQEHLSQKYAVEKRFLWLLKLAMQANNRSPIALLLIGLIAVATALLVANSIFMYWGNIWADNMTRTAISLTNMSAQSGGPLYVTGGFWSPTPSPTADIANTRTP